MPEDSPTTPARTFEQELKDLEQIVRDLDTGDLPLEEALKRYEAGVAGLRQCYGMLRDAQAKIEKLVEKPSGELTTQPMRVETTEAEPGA